MSFWKKAGLFVLAVVAIYALSIAFIPGAFIVGISTIVFSIYAYIFVKRKDKNASTDLLNVSKKLPRILFVTSIIIFAIGIVFIIVYYQTINVYNVCDVCNGSGNIVTSNGSIDGCSACRLSGKGSSAKAYDEPQWVGSAILCWAISAWFFLCSRFVSKHHKENSNNENVIHIDTKTASFNVALGHWHNGKSGKVWISNQADSSGSWGINCSIVYTGAKTASKSHYYFIPYDANNIQLDTVTKLSCSSHPLTPNAKHTIWWEKLWVGKNVDHIVLTKIELNYTDGSIQVIDIVDN